MPSIDLKDNQTKALLADLIQDLDARLPLGMGSLPELVLEA